ncbi:MAG TPA: bifunctional phosphopantothenoylcysteine decarboxylase/phosphopantothenate--cysteine ligase CoaBC [Polyangiaceae bacterium]|nr:bifunctional phosphopantothenoylcysteine decarboxylase/phosphopantothenate--cysteine ligase CoaBC [Polyangiaceae bacterium]
MSSGSDKLPRPAAGAPVAFDPPAPPESPDRSARTELELTGKRFVLCVTGSIAAYKAIVLLRLLLKHGAKVSVVITASAEKFVQTSTFSALTGEATHSEMFGQPGEPHVDLARSADAVLIVPATADCLARLAHGLANDLISALVLAARCPVLIAPAMHPAMWEHPRTQHNVLILQSQTNVTLVGPVAGEVASGEYGLGRMAEPEDIFAAIMESVTPDDLGGRHVVITAGPTREAIDPVRYLSNRSSGKMGFALAERAAQRGARVTLIAGPVQQRTPRGVERINVVSALEMQEALANVFGSNLANADVLIMAAAVADYRALDPSPDKLKRSDRALTLELSPNPDILAGIAARRTGKSPVLVGFALETADEAELFGLARQKLIKKRVDMIVANRSEALDSNESTALLVSVRDCVELGVRTKTALADDIMNWVAEKLAALESDEATE